MDWATDWKFWEALFISIASIIAFTRFVVEPMEAANKKLDTLQEEVKKLREELKGRR